MGISYHRNGSNPGQGYSLAITEKGIACLTYGGYPTTRMEVVQAKDGKYQAKE